MCTECGCSSKSLPFGVKVLRAIAPSLVKARPASEKPAELGVPSSPTRESAEKDTNQAPRSHEPSSTGPKTIGIDLHAPILAENDAIAASNRAGFARRNILALNLVSSPGAGKTTLLSRTLDEFGHTCPCAVVVGDLETDNDARRLHRPHVPVAQITTGTACHLDARMVARTVAELPLDHTRVLFIENVGNLVCPADFDLGEAIRVVLLSATEGEDKPLKYPPIFKSAHVVLLTKIDVAQILGFDRAAAVENIRRIAPQATLIEVSARSGEGMDAWYEYLRSHLV